MSENKPSRLKPIIDMLPILLQPDLIRVVIQALDILRRVGAQPTVVGTYEVLDHECCLDVMDVAGRDAHYIKRQRVRFVQNNVIAYQDTVWGDGEVFAEYECSPGVAVDRYKEGHRNHVLVSLRKTMNRGDEQNIYIRRRIRNGFTKTADDLQVEINHHTHKLTMRVSFPVGRSPAQCWVIEQNARRTQLLDTSCVIRLPDQRVQVTWQTEKPKLFEAYILRWQW